MSLVRTTPKAKDFMTPDPVCVEPSTRIPDLARIFEAHEISGAPVVDHEGRVIGVVSKTDLVRRRRESTGGIPPAYLFEILSEQGEDAETGEAVPDPLVRVGDLMTEDPLMVSPELPIAAVARLMLDHRVHRVIVADDGELPLGIITASDLPGAFSPSAARARRVVPTPHGDAP